jgi:hemoglobin
VTLDNDRQKRVDLKLGLFLHDTITKVDSNFRRLTKLNQPAAKLHYKRMRTRDSLDPLEMSEPSFYQKLGGDAAIDATVEEFYTRVLKDPLLEPFFVNIPMERQRGMQKSFLKHVFGGREYNGKSMRTAHKKLHLTDEHFDRVAKHLSDSLLFLGVAPELVLHVLEVAETTRNDVLGK